MTTNQMMEVRITKDLIITIGHKTKMGKVDSIVHHGNMLREQRGLRPVDIREILTRQDFWEFVIARNTQNFNKIQTPDSGVCDIQAFSDYSVLNQYKDSHGKLQYSKLVKDFPMLIKTQRGGRIENRGYWMDLHILLKVASMLDKDLEVRIYDIFINEQLLIHRDDGGEAFKRLNKAIDTLPDRTPTLKPKGNKGCYINIAKMLRHKLDLDGKGYNGTDANALIQAKREKYEDNLVFAIKVGLITSYAELKSAIEKL